jgi:hypothetical protein
MAGQFERTALAMGSDAGIPIAGCRIPARRHRRHRRGNPIRAASTLPLTGHRRRSWLEVEEDGRVPPVIEIERAREHCSKGVIKDAGAVWSFYVVDPRIRRRLAMSAKLVNRT